MKKNSLTIIGAGGHGKVCLETALRMKKWDSFSFLDDRKDIRDVLGYPIIGDTSDFSKIEGDVFVAIGDNAVRISILKSLIESEMNIISLIDPNAVVSQFASIAKGCVIVAGAIVNAAATLGMGTIVNTNAVVDHDCNLGDCVHVCPGATVCGANVIGDRVWVGTGAVIIQGQSICSDVVIGANSTIVAAIASPGVYVGTPVRKL
ncbi:acetyltransferase [Erysipelothrix sp. HDW6C]|uniref:acetyltransferase n=1 Tax=Erysipelothrix sp. HDW6C TaxID=2714930 RepID=UPI0014075655|nr:acetyltransferase [Erysipelothrix sp. HDW6C]QIK70026.1 acetyltransferase [Erysipelothrix sp. HDW6C]